MPWRLVPSTLTCPYLHDVISNEFPKAKQITDEKLKYGEFQNLIYKLEFTAQNLYFYAYITII